MRPVHATPRPEAAMNDHQPDETIGPIFAEFMADQAARLSPESYRQYVMIIDHLGLYQDRYRPGYWRREYEAAARPDGAFRGVPEAVDLTRRFPQFLRDFLPCEIGVSTETLRTAGTVIEALGAWLIAEGYVARNKPARKRVDRAARDLLATRHLPGLFED
jgi:hypothetical protein